MKARTKQAIRCHHVPSHALIHPRTERLGLGKSTFIVFICIFRFHSDTQWLLFRHVPTISVTGHWWRKSREPTWLYYHVCSTITAYWITPLCQDPVLFEWSCTENTSTSCWTRANFWQFVTCWPWKQGPSRLLGAIMCHPILWFTLRLNVWDLGLGKSTVIVFIDFTQVDSGYCSDMFRQFQWLATDKGNQ